MFRESLRCPRRLVRCPGRYGPERHACAGSGSRGPAEEEGGPQGDRRGPRGQGRPGEVSQKKKVEIGGKTYYVTEGDLLTTEEELIPYAKIQKSRQDQYETFKSLGIDPAKTQGGQSELISVTEGGRIVKWPANTVLTYCVLRGTFPDESKYRTVVENFGKAARGWEEICGVKFQHKQELDGSPGEARPNGVVFPVQFKDVGGEFIAAAFFPNDPPEEWRVVVDPSYYEEETFDRIGVFRHELGHTLGFRHEHIRSLAPPQCPHEPVFNTFELTDYDPKSVMHYFCGGVGSKSLSFTDIDKNGAKLVYGPPLGSVRLIEVPGQGH